MTISSFRCLRHHLQVHVVLTQGTYLACRWRTSGGVRLYHLLLAGTELFVELRHHPCCASIRIVRSFTEAAPLSSYLAGIELPHLPGGRA